MFFKLGLAPWAMGHFADHQVIILIIQVILARGIGANIVTLEFLFQVFHLLNAIVGGCSIQAINHNNKSNASKG